MTASPEALSEAAHVTIVFPATDESALSSMLRQITAAIDHSRGEVGGYGLGGENGYGALWDSDTFAMHPFCWCDGDECPWCAYSPEEGRRLTPQALQHGAVESFADQEGGAPNFWHKQSGLRVWWYKYIGRSVSIYGDGDLAVIGADCLRDIARTQQVQS